MYHNRSLPEIFAELKTDPKRGLESHEATKRLTKYGKNLLPKKPKPRLLKLFLCELNDPIIFLLLVAVAVSLFVGETIDAIAIILIVLTDAAMGTYQENKANNIVDALDKLVKDTVLVLRDGEKREISAEDLTVGDILLLESGDRISADARLIEVQNFTVDESVLTGESLQAEKTVSVIAQKSVPIGDRLNMVFSGTTAVSGRARAVVTNIGRETELGKIADSLAVTKAEKSPLTLRIEKFSRQISLMVLVVSAVIAAVMALRGAPLNTLLLTVIAFAVSVLPEGLPLALTMALTIASNRMAKQNVVVRKLKSAESLGSCTVIASDKTGTLTVNEQTAKKLLLPDGTTYNVSGTGYDLTGTVTAPSGADLEPARQLALLGVLNNEASIKNGHFSGDSIDLAFLVLGEKLKVKTHNIAIIDTVPYESENKYSAVFYECDGEYFCTVKGSPEVVYSFCDGKFPKSKLAQQNESLAADGFRVIALAHARLSADSVRSRRRLNDKIKNLHFDGMVGFIDPIRKEAKASVKECAQAGIKVLMITGDHPLTALSIAKDLGLATDRAQIASGDELKHAKEQGKRFFDDFIAEKTVFARVAPLQKLDIVESLKRRGEFVAVTGDGVNDAPALKSANIGVAMGSGTDIARDTADMIIIDDNFKSIVAGIKEGRVAYANIRKIIFFLISCGVSEAILFCLSLIFDFGAPLLAIQLLWLNLVTDGIQDFALSFESAEKDILKEPPRPPDEALFDRSLVLRILASGAFIGIIVFIVLWQLRRGFNVDAAVARGHIMFLLAVIQNIHVFNCRSEHQSAFKIPIRNNPLVFFGVLGTIALQFFVSESAFFNRFLHSVPVPLNVVAILSVIALSILPAMELYKAFTAKNAPDRRHPVKR